MADPARKIQKIKKFKKKIVNQDARKTEDHQAQKRFSGQKIQKKKINKKNRQEKRNQNGAKGIGRIELHNHGAAKPQKQAGPEIIIKNQINNNHEGQIQGRQGIKKIIKKKLKKRNQQNKKNRKDVFGHI